MKPFRFPALGIVGLILTVGALSEPGSQPQPSGAREDAYRANNLGVALLEQYNYDEAARSFRNALDQDPNLNIARVNLAIAVFYAGNSDEALTLAQSASERNPDLPQPPYITGLASRAQNQLDVAVRAFRRVLEVDPSDIGSRINLGQILVQQRQYADAADLFREALAAEPFNVTAAYGLATSLTRSGASERAREAMQRFESLRDSSYGVTYAQRYLEQGRYAEAIASTGAEPDLVDPRTPPVTFADVTGDLPAAARKSVGGGTVTSSTAGGSVTLFDVDGDGDLDAFSTSAADGGRLYVNENGRFSDATDRAGLSADAARAATAAVTADYDNDGRPDLLLLRPGLIRLLRQRPDRRFEDVTGASGITPASGASRSAAFVDVDHDGDLDIFIAGGQLLRNNGNGSFTDITAAAGLADAAPGAFAIGPTDFDNRRDIDLLVIGSGGPRLYQNMRDGTFRDVASSVGLDAVRPKTTAAYTAFAAADVNKDTYTDFLFASADAAGVLALSDGHGRFRSAQLPDVPAGVTIAQFVDYDNDGLLDLFTASGRQLRLLRNVGTTWVDVSEPARVTALAAGLAAEVQSVAFGDIDRDGDLDCLLLLTSGELRSWRNEGGSANRSLLVRLVGRVSNRGGVGSKVDVRAGSLRQRLEASAVTPALAPADILFGLGTRTAADVVRVIWPSGTLQSETIGDTRVTTVTELDRKPSSCPYLYTWNGTRFEFVTDFMGGGEIGYWHGPGVWNTPDPEEYVRIPPGHLLPRNGRYDLRVTNELEEALFVDRLQLVAVDHPDGVAVFPNEGLDAPASASFKLTTTGKTQPLAGAVDEHGRDVVSRLIALDRKYPDGFGLLDIRGYAEPHELRLDLGDAASNPVLLATGWTDYAFSSDNVAAHQRGLSLTPPSLDVRSPSGEWRPLIPSIGIPVGRPQTIVIDLRGKLRSGEHVVRIVTNMRIYWDRILVDASGGDVPTRVTRIDPIVADLQWRGFSAEVAPDGREPWSYDYDRVSRVSIWKTMVGRYTREGDVRKLLKSVDDMFVIARPGDEIVLSFDQAALPPLAAGASRTFLLYADGFSKEMDIRSASPHEVEPLPFHDMTAYPYGAREHYPSTQAHRDYQARYNTRVVSRSLPPLETVSAPASTFNTDRLRKE